MGEQSADLALIPDLAFIDATPESARIRGYMPTRANYQLIVDNILDLSHADYLHPTTLGGMMTASTARTVEESDRITTEWLALDCVPPNAFRPMLPPDVNANIVVEVVWRAPALMVLGTAAVPAGDGKRPDELSYTLHNMTPETATTTHYFFCNTRHFLVHDAGVTAMLREVVTQAFLREDKPMLEAQQARMGTDDLWSLHPILLPVDNGAVRARRKLSAMIDAEA
jgi:vanillate O-demethylase monooxygenase subunit